VGYQPGAFGVDPAASWPSSGSDITNREVPVSSSTMLITSDEGTVDSPVARQLAWPV